MSWRTVRCWHVPRLAERVAERPDPSRISSRRRCFFWSRPRSGTGRNTGVPQCAPVAAGSARVPSPDQVPDPCPYRRGRAYVGESDGGAVLQAVHGGEDNPARRYEEFPGNEVVKRARTRSNCRAVQGEVGGVHRQDLEIGDLRGSTKDRGDRIVAIVPATGGIDVTITVGVQERTGGADPGEAGVVHGAGISVAAGASVS